MGCVVYLLRHTLSQQYTSLCRPNQEPNPRRDEIGLGILIAVTCFALDINDDPKERDYIFGSGIGYPLRNMARLFLPKEKRANFTFFHGVEGVAVQEGKLVLSLVGKKATLGWGNYLRN